VTPMVPAAEAPEGGTGEPLGLKQRVARAARAVLEPLAGFLAGAGVRADFLSAIGLMLSLAAALAFFEGWFRGGALLTALAGLFDLLDGQVARHAASRSRFGAFLDSTLDRFGEGAILTGLAGFYISGLVALVLDPALVAAQFQRGLMPSTWAAVGLTAVVALVGSFMVSYTRARAEGLGLDCKVGWFERPERMVLLIVAGAFGVGPVMPAALLLYVILSFSTAAQRVAYVWKHTRAVGRDA
jgi:CDP-diacylglycerol--glycerol-3-phosphate 3-phosphatidyltransferase